MAVTVSYAKLRVYLAGPEVFLENAVELGIAKKALCEKYWFEGAYPLDSGADMTGSKLQIACNISAANEQLIRSCSLLIANMTPFRGPSMDVGTAYEMGFARALHKPVLGYTATALLYNERMRRLLGPFPSKNQGGDIVDDDGLFVEDFDMHDNLMLDGAVRASGFEVQVHSAEGRNRFNALEGFERCLQVAQKALYRMSDTPTHV